MNIITLPLLNRKHITGLPLCPGSQVNWLPQISVAHENDYKYLSKKLKIYTSYVQTVIQSGLEVSDGCVHVITNHLPFVICHVRVVHAKPGRCIGFISYYDEALELSITKCRHHVHYPIYIHSFLFLDWRWLQLHWCKVLNIVIHKKEFGVDHDTVLRCMKQFFPYSYPYGTLEFKQPDLAQW